MTSKDTKNAWIDDRARLISFSQLATGEEYRAEETIFWSKILTLMHAGYRMQ